MEDEIVKLGLYTYTELIKIEENYKKLLTIILDNTKLSYDNKRLLLIDDELILNFVKYYDYGDYTTRIRDLKTKANEGDE